MDVDRWITDGEASRRFPFYTRANVGEVAPNPVTPMTATLVWDAVARGWADGYFRWGSIEAGELDRDPPEAVALFGGFAYLNWSLIRLHGERSPGMSADMMDAAFFGDYPDIPPYVEREGDRRPDLSERIQSTMDWVMSRSEVPDELADDRSTVVALRSGRPDMAAISDGDLVARATAMSPLMREMFEPYFVYGNSSAIALGILTELCVSMPAGTPGRLISGLGGIDSTPPTHAIWELSRLVRDSPTLTSCFDEGLHGLAERIEGTGEGDLFRRALADVQHEHGARGPIEWELGNPTWETDADLVLALVDRMRHAGDELSPQVRHERARADRAAAEADVREAIAGNAEAIAALELGLRLADVFVAARERTKLNMMMVIHEARLALHELAHRAALRGDLDDPAQLFMLRASELEGFVDQPAPMIDELRRRADTFATLSGLQEPFIITDAVPPIEQWPSRTTDTTPAVVGQPMHGVPASPGIVTGTARVIRDLFDPRELKTGDVLVAPFTDPAWTPLFVTASAVVVEVGAPMSHAMIVSREFGIPCVTAVVGICDRIADGALVHVDGNAGTVTLLEP